MAVTKGLVLPKFTTMRTFLTIIALAFVVMSCTTNNFDNNDEYGNIYDNGKLIKYVSQNQDTTVWYDWSPSELFYIGNGRYVYMGYPCVVDAIDDADVLAEIDCLQELDEYGQYSDTYYELLSVFSPVWIESQQCYTLYRW